MVEAINVEVFNQVSGFYVHSNLDQGVRAETELVPAFNVEFADKSLAILVVLEHGLMPLMALPPRVVCLIYGLSWCVVFCCHFVVVSVVVVSVVVSVFVLPLPPTKGCLRPFYRIVYCIFY